MEKFEFDSIDKKNWFQLYFFYRSARSRANRRRRHRRGGNGDGAGVVLTNYNSGDRFSPVNDPPPKYTPPPSYSTATGAR